MINYTLQLDYQLNPGWLEPYVSGLKNGKLVARLCASCSRTSLPPSRCCSCGHSVGSWKTISGSADIVYRCSGTDGDFALVQFHGVDTLTVVALHGVPPNALTGVIKQTEDDLPRLILQAESTQGHT